MAIIRRAETEAEIQRCHAVMAELRPHVPAAAFVAQVRRQQERHGYVLVFLEDPAGIQTLAGYRILECLAWGRFLYVDDLVTASGARGRGYGQQMMEWLLDEAGRERCEQFHLDSGVQRFEAHGLYLKNRLHITCHHFARTLA